ncbi:hypothetical protein JTB14_014111 [Gonioctena quinquepunctata]|nr:hypothetical protein JTB14_014111 [Gonioctena quinquepunctata]
MVAFRCDNRHRIYRVVVGGVISDKIVAKMGIRSRCVIACCEPTRSGTILAFGSVFLHTYWGHAEMWFGILFAMVVEIVPLKVQLCFFYHLSWMSPVQSAPPPAKNLSGHDNVVFSHDESSLPTITALVRNGKRMENDTSRM